MSPWRVLGLAALLVLLPQAAAPDDITGVAQPCSEGEWLPASAPIGSALDGSNIRLLNWNIQKYSQSGWAQDLRELALDSDLLLLQEATLEQGLQRTIAAMAGTRDE